MTSPTLIIGSGFLCGRMASFVDTMGSVLIARSDLFASGWCNIRLIPTHAPQMPTLGSRSNNILPDDKNEIALLQFDHDIRNLHVLFIKVVGGDFKDDVLLMLGNWVPAHGFDEIAQPIMPVSFWQVRPKFMKPERFFSDILQEKAR